MSWNSFLDTLYQQEAYELTPLEMEVIQCFDEENIQTKNDLLKAFIKRHYFIEEEAFTQRLKNIYKRFQISGRGRKLPKLQKYLSEQYLKYQNKDAFFSEIGLDYIHPKFPRDAFGDAIDALIRNSDVTKKKVDILQTFAPNLDDYIDHLTRCLQNQIPVRILLAWPYSQAAKLREAALRKYSNHYIEDDIHIRDDVIANLETLEKINRRSGSSDCLQIKLYDTLPSLAIYRAGDYMLASPFLHNLLAVNTFQLELKLNTSNPLVHQTLKDDFSLMWQVARSFNPDSSRNWRNDLKILFSD